MGRIMCRIGSPLEERLNVVTHALGLAASIAALPFLLQIGARHGDGWVVFGTAVFGVTLVCAYAASTMYHAAPPGPVKELWLRVDYVAVYLLIAGTYTPFMLGALRGPVGITMLVIVWGGALTGIFAKLRLGSRYPNLSTMAYLALGWIALIAAGPMVKALGWDGVRWIVAGGLAYSLGVIPLTWQHRLKFGHCAWHVFVLGGSACHFVAVAAYGIRIPQ
jgi:hemolysin III